MGPDLTAPEPDLDEVLGDDRDRAVVFGAGEPVEHGQYASRGGVLDGEYEALDEVAKDRAASA